MFRRFLYVGAVSSVFINLEKCVNLNVVRYIEIATRMSHYVVPFEILDERLPYKHLVHNNLDNQMVLITTEEHLMFVLFSSIFHGLYSQNL